MTRLNGVMPILQTPFLPDGTIDEESMINQVEFCISSGVSGVVFPANASEFFCLSDIERMRTTEVVVEAVAGRVRSIVCVSGTSSSHAIEFARHAATLPVDAVMALPPYTRRASAGYIVEYFDRVAGECGLPTIVQNVGPPLGTPLDDRGLETLLERVPGVRAIKEERVPTTHRIGALASRYGERLDGIFGGANGIWLVQEARRGATGCMPAAALVDLQVRVQECLDDDDWKRAEELQERIQPLLAYLSLYGVAMVKHLLAQRGVLASPTVRDPEAPTIGPADIEEVDRWMGDLMTDRRGVTR